MRFSGSIRLNLLLVVLATILPVLAFELWSGQERREHHIQDARLTLLRLVDYFATQQEAETTMLRSILEAAAATPAVRAMDGEACNELMRHLLLANPHYVNFALLDARGEAVASALPFTRQNLSARVEVQQALAGEGMHVGQFSIGRVSKEQVLPFSCPVRGADGAVVGVLLTTQRLQDISSLFTISEMPVGSFFGLSDNTGVRLFRLPPAEAAPVGGHISEGVWKRLQSAPELTVITEVGTDGIPREMAVARVSLEPGQPPYLYVFAGIPWSDVVAEADRATLRSLWWLGAALALASVLAYLSARYGIHTPLASLTSTAKRIGKGELTARTGLADMDGSIGTLAASIDDMAASLERDRSARDRAEQEANAQKALINAVLAGAADAIFVKDADGRYLLANSEVARVVGKPVEQILGHTDADLFPSAEAEIIHANDIRVMRENVTRTDREVLSTTEGPQTYLAIKGPLHDAEGRVHGIFGISHNITDQLKMQELLVQTEKMMSVGGLAAGLAHEINNPLSGIMQNVQVLTRRLAEDLPANERAAQAAGCPLDNMREYLRLRNIPEVVESIREAGSRAAHIVGSMLDFSRAGDSRLIPADLATLLDKSVALCATDFDITKHYDFKSITIVREYEPGLPSVPCLKTQLQQVFLNLLVNAAHAMATTPSPTLRLRVAAEGEHIRVEIEDNGPGMDEAARKKVFEPFFTTKPVGQGTGLGLSISYFIVVTHHNGSMEVRSAPGQGACFIIRLPLARPEDATAAA